MANAPEDAWLIERLAKSHDRSQFSCGEIGLDDWLKTRAGQFDRKDLARTFVALTPGQVRVLGYYALASHRVRLEALPEDQAKGLPKIDVPVVLLGRLAVDASVHGKGLGSFLLIDALRRALLGPRKSVSEPSKWMPWTSEREGFTSSTGSCLCGTIRTIFICRYTSSGNCVSEHKVTSRLP